MLTAPGNTCKMTELCSPCVTYPPSLSMGVPLRKVVCGRADTRLREFRNDGGEVGNRGQLTQTEEDFLARGSLGVHIYTVS